MADRDVAGVITQKNIFPDWSVQNWHVYPDPRARFADPFNPDRPPYPPDDYAARVLSPNPQRPTKKSGVGRFDGDGYLKLLAHWDAENRAGEGAGRARAGTAETGVMPAAATTDPPPADGAEPLPVPHPADPSPAASPAGEPSAASAANYLRALTSNQQGYRIKLEQAVELGLINSREFQDRREDLYLAALPVTLERFSFATQAFFTEQVVRDFASSQLPDAGRFWRADTTAGLGRNFITGASLLASFANQVVIELGSNRPEVAVSTLSLSLVQPLLRGGGLAVTLEGLTQAERNLLYAIRSYARFRKLFYVAIAAGGDYTNNPYGLQGLAVNLGRGVGANLTAPSIGYLSLLQQAAVIANQRTNVSFLERLLEQYQAYGEGGQISDLQIGQVEVQLLNSRGNLINGGGGTVGIRQYLDALDNFKLQLGLPLTVGLDLDDAPLRPMREQIGRFEAVYEQLRRLAAEANRYDPNEPPAQSRPRWRRYLTESDLVKGTAFAEGILNRWDALSGLSNEELAARVRDLTRRRSALLDRRADRRVRNEPEPPDEARQLRQLEADLELVTFEQALRAYEAQPWLREKEPTQARLREAAFRAMVNAFLQLVLEARNERLAAIRRQWPRLPPLAVGDTDLLTADLDTAYTAGIQTALTRRLDLMNARALVVDAYRQIAVLANSLQGVFDVRYDGNAVTPLGDNRPFAFDARRSRQQLTVRAELPLVRRAERNQYRAALIAYQRQRRTLMAFEDNIANDVRAEIRLLRTLAELYKIQQRVVELGYSQVDSARETLFAPLAAGTNLDAGASAALTQQLLQAQSSLLSAQNALFNLWVSYQAARMNLYLDLELMQLDDRGVWIDEPATRTQDPARGDPAGPPERLPLPAGVDPVRRPSSPP